jgi:alpha-tubulin suppressor-like RCC1 family protein
MSHHPHHPPRLGTLLILFSLLLGGGFLASPVAQAAPPTFTSLALGNAHTCALSAAGGVWCWGYNAYGQLGDGTTTNRSTPVPVSGLSSGVTAITAGESHTCALTGSGVRCWGHNQYGQLGDGTTTNRFTPVAVSGPSTIVAIAAGLGHSCAATIASSTVCWGLNDYGQLGDGTTTNRSTPVAVRNLRVQAVALTAGMGHTCLLSSAGAVRCWGDNQFGQLGDGTTTAPSIPTVVRGMSSGVRAVAAGAYHTCALLTSADGARCWGNNLLGQLGDGTTTHRPSPVRVSMLDGYIAAIAPGYLHTCALLGTIGYVMCWGHNFYGQLGNGFSGSGQTQPGAVSGQNYTSRAIGAGWTHSCSLPSAGGVKCWGYNLFGQLGNGNAYHDRTPVDVLFAPLFTSAAPPTSAAIGVAYRHTFSATGFPEPGFSLASGSLPPGLSLDGASGRLDGTPTQGGSFSFTVQATNGAGSSTQLVTLEIPKLSQTISLSAPADATYGDPPITLSVRASSGLPIALTVETPAVCTLLIAGASTSVQINAAGSCTISATQMGDGAYLPAAPVSHTLSIARAPLTVTAQDTTMAVGAALPAFSTFLSGFVNGETLATSGVGGAASCTTPSAASPPGSYPITCSAGSLTAANYTFSTFVPGTLTVTGQAIPQITWPAPDPIPYGTALGPTQLAAAAHFGGQPLAGAFSYQPAAGTRLSVGAGQVLQVTFTPADTSTYATVSAQVQLTVTKAPLTVTAQDATMVTGAELPALSAQISGFVNGETLATSGVIGAASCTTPSAGDLPGSYPITCSAGSLTAANYTFSTFVPGTLTVTGQAIPQITWPTPDPIAYGTALGPSQLAAAARFGGQPLAGTFSYQPAAGARLSAGTGQVLQVTFTPADTSTYATVSAQVQLTVTKAPLTVTAQDATMVAGAHLPALDAQISGFVNGETLATSGVRGTAACSTSATPASPPGSYPITCSAGSLAAANYTFTAFVPGTLTITSPPRVTVYLPLVRR